MATSRLMPPTSSPGSSVPRQGLLCSPLATGADHNRVSSATALGSMNMDELLRDIYGEASLDEISAYGEGNMNGADMYPGMTLEDYLARAGVVREEEMGAAPGMAVVPQSMEMATLVAAGTVAGLADPFSAAQQQQVEGAFLGIGNGVRGRRRPVNEPVDKAALQRQRRMIKNRESAARSRERKQAHTVELESLAAQLEEENMRLKGEKEKDKMDRLKELMETRIPVTQRKKQPRQLRRTYSMAW